MRFCSSFLRSLFMTLLKVRLLCVCVLSGFCVQHNKNEQTEIIYCIMGIRLHDRDRIYFSICVCVYAPLFALFGTVWIQAANEIIIMLFGLSTTTESQIIYCIVIDVTCVISIKEPLPNDENIPFQRWLDFWHLFGGWGETQAHGNWSRWKITK